MLTTDKDQSARRIRSLLFAVFGIPGFGICVGLAAYHFHWREALMSKYTGPQIDLGLDVLCFLLIAMLVTDVARRVVVQTKYRGR